MKKNFKYYIIAWAALLAVYNVVVFAIQPLTGFVKYDTVFWIAWAFVIAAFVGQLICASVAFKAENSERLFLNISLITESYTALIIMAVAGSVLMLIPNCPAWIVSVVCVVIFGFSAITIIKAKAAAEIVSDVSEKVKGKTLFIKSLSVDAESLISRAQSEEIKAELKKVADAVRYSDPMSSDALSGIESRITLKFDEFSRAVESGNGDAVRALGNALSILIADRNKKCRMLK